MRGFSLIKITLIVSFFVILLGITIFILNPAKQQALENNSKRSDDVEMIANAVVSYIIVNEGELPGGLSIINQEISSKGVDLCKALIPYYIVTLPKDPSLRSQDATEPCDSDYKTNYFIVLNRDNTLTISAPHTAIPPAEIVIFANRKLINR